MENGFFGTDEHRRMQAKSDSLAPWILDTPGACITGRVISSDDCGALGWDIIRKHLIEDEMFGFRFMSPVEMEEVRNELLDLGAKIQTWVGFHGQAEPVAQAIAPILSQKIPDSLHVKRLEGGDLVEMQAFLAAQGMTPISTASLGGTLFPAVALGVIDDNGQLMAVGWGAMSQNRFSNHAKCAWAGLFAVAPEAQGNGLGKRINAEVLRICLEEFDADAVMEFAALGNAASISMITSVGLQQTDRVSAVAMLGGERSFTR